MFNPTANALAPIQEESAKAAAMAAVASTGHKSTEGECTGCVQKGHIDA